MTKKLRELENIKIDLNNKLDELNTFCSNIVMQ